MKIVNTGLKLSLSVAVILLVGCGITPVQEPIVVAPIPCECPVVEVPVCPPLPPVEKPVICPKIKAPVKIKEVPINKPVVEKQTDLLTIGRVEKVAVEQLNLTFNAKIDTGARLPSLNALGLSYFERDGKKWVRFGVINPTTNQKQTVELPLKRMKVIKQLDGKNQQRPVVSLTLKLGSVTDQVDVNLSDRTGYNYQLLIGRDFIIGRFNVDVDQIYIADKK